MKKIIKWDACMTLKRKLIFLKKNNKNNFFKKNKDFIQVMISFCSLLVTIVVAILISSQQLDISKKQSKLSEQNFKLSEQVTKANLEMNSESRPLEYDLTVKLNGDSKNTVTFESSKDEVAVTVPLRIESSIRRGKIRALYCIPLNEKLDLELIEAEKAETISYTVRGNYETVKSSPIDMFFVFIDDTDKVFFEYYCVLPEYITTNVQEKINETAYTHLQLSFFTFDTFTVNNYEIVTSKYENILNKDSSDKFNLMSHEELTTKYKKILDFVNKEVLYK